MLEPWNNAELLSPPVNMFLCVKKFDTSALRHICNNIIKVLSKQSPLHKESALCSRFLYKYDRKFRNDIGYRNFRKVHTALKKYLTVNLLKDVENFQSALPSLDDNEKYLPTRQMLEYLMLRIITFSMILLRICVCSKQAAIFYLNRIKRGEAHWMSLLPYALLSRLWSISMVLVQHSTTWYSNLYPYLSKLELKGLKFLPENYELPGNLEQWLDLKNVDNFGRFDWDQKKIVQMAHGLLDDDENDLFDSILSFVNQINKNECDKELEQELEPILNECKDQYNSLISDINEDHGEILSRKSFKMDQGEILSRDCFQSQIVTKKVSAALSMEAKGEALSRESFRVLLNTQNKETKGNNQQSNEAKGIRQNFNEPKGKKQQSNLAKANKQQTNEVKGNKQMSKNNKQPTSTKNSGECALHTKVTNATSLKEFIKKEETYRNGTDNRSLTNHLSLMQWHALKNSLLQLGDTLTNRKIERKFQKIWNEKCLNYK